MMLHATRLKSAKYKTRDKRTLLNMYELQLDESSYGCDKP